MQKIRIGTLLLLCLLLWGCAPQTPLIEDAQPAATTGPGLARVDEADNEITATPQDVETEPADGLALATPAGYPAPADPDPAAEEAYPAAEAEETATNTDTAYPPAESEEMVDEPNPADADVTFVRAVQAADGSWTFEVTVEHPDTGEEDYANGWDIITTEGEVIKKSIDEPFTFVLTHPHIDEQPVTRSQSGLIIPQDVTEVFVRAHDIVHGWGGQIVYVDLTTSSGPNYEVERSQ